jgi:GntR family carbon starvation induced transcriptional regulator
MVNEDTVSTLVDLALRRIREDILRGVLVAGSKLRVDVLRNKYDIGASPLREALSRLVSYGLVTSQGQRGFRVASVSQDGIRDITNTRKLLEHAALKESLTNGDNAWEREVIEAYENLDKEHTELSKTLGKSVDSWEEANNKFHDALVSRCKSTWVLNFRKIIYDQATRYRRSLILNHKEERRAHNDHTQMLNAALSYDIEMSCKLVDKHADAQLKPLNI